MLTKVHLIESADLFRSLTGVEEVTLSYRVFGDTKKLRQLRGESGITLDRFNAAMIWFAQNWPADAELPERLVPYRADAAPTAESSPAPDEEAA